jgi:pyridoxamine 5'-phosphate oxidase family protein
MSAFTEKELAYLREQRLGRLATVNGRGEPHVVPVGFRYNGEPDVIDVGGHDFAKSKKYWDALATGRAEVLGEGGDEIGPGFASEVIRIHPERIVGWGIDSDAYRQNGRFVGGERA